MIFAKKDAVDKFAFLNDLPDDDKAQLVKDAMDFFALVKGHGEGFYAKWRKVFDLLTPVLATEIPSLLIKAQLGTVTSIDEGIQSMKSPALANFWNYVVLRVEALQTETN